MIEASQIAVVPVNLRPEQPEDESFLQAVYADARAEELKRTNWDDLTKRSFLAFQFQAQRKGYREMYPDADFLIVLAGEERAGRMVVNRTAEEIRLVDIAFLAAFQRRGIGARVLKPLIEEARQTRRPLRVNVFNGNSASEFYTRLGFVKTNDAGVYSYYEWRSSEGSRTKAGR